MAIHHTGISCESLARLRTLQLTDETPSDAVRRADCIVRNLPARSKPGYHDTETGHYLWTPWRAHPRGSQLHAEYFLDPPISDVCRFGSSGAHSERSDQRDASGGILPALAYSGKSADRQRRLRRRVLQSQRTGEFIVRAAYVAQTLDQLRNQTPLTLAAPPANVPVFIPGCSIDNATFDCPS